MIRTVAAWFMRTASWKSVLLLTIAMVTLFYIIVLFVSPQIRDATGGMEPFDTTFPLTAEDIVIGLQSYNADAVSAYLLFAALDLPFLFVSGMWFVMLLAWLIQCSGIAKLIQLAESGLILLGLVTALSDLTENIVFVTLVTSHRGEVTSLVEFGAAVHAFKFQSINVAWLIIAVLVIAALWGRFQRSRKTAGGD